MRGAHTQVPILGREGTRLSGRLEAARAARCVVLSRAGHKVRFGESACDTAAPPAFDDDVDRRIERSRADREAVVRLKANDEPVRVAYAERPSQLLVVAREPSRAIGRVIGTLPLVVEAGALAHGGGHLGAPR